MRMVELSVVIPVYREARVVPELAERCSRAATSTGLCFEVLLVDDASFDGTPECVRSLPAELSVRALELPTNHGQFRATQAGLRAAQGELVVVLDGDLQDPPEAMVDLVAAHLRRSAEPAGQRVTFAVKRTRQDPAWFRAGRRLFALGQRALGSALPSGAGSYCVMDRELALRVAEVPLRAANLSSVVSALGGSAIAVPYEKNRRYDERSRVGFLGLAREALGSLAIDSPVGRAWLRRVSKRGR